MLKKLKENKERVKQLESVTVKVMEEDGRIVKKKVKCEVN